MTYCTTPINQNKVDIFWSRQWLQFNPDSLTLTKRSKLTGGKIKLFTNSLPMADILHRKYMKLSTPNLCIWKQMITYSYVILPWLSSITLSKNWKLHLLKLSVFAKEEISTFINNNEFFNWTLTYHIC